jgi:hypothetical protein
MLLRHLFLTTWPGLYCHCLHDISSSYFCDANMNRLAKARVRPQRFEQVKVHNIIQQLSTGTSAQLMYRNYALHVPSGGKNV